MKVPASTVPTETPMSSGNSAIRIRGARTHNLKNIDLDIPHDRLTVITGPSGCGKSSLAMDTVFAESQRQYLETLSLFARQFIEQIPRPDIDTIDGLLPSLRVDQEAASNQSRSTVGTVTEINDYLRLLFARFGEIHCPKCGAPIHHQSCDEIAAWIRRLPEFTKVMLLAPLVRGRKGKQTEVLDRIRSERLVRVRIDGQLFDIEDAPSLDHNQSHDIEAIVDRIVVRPGLETRLAESLELALRISGGTVLVCQATGDSANPTWLETLFSTKHACPDCDLSVFEPEPRNFSFNSPYGACSTCQGLGRQVGFSRDLSIPNKQESLAGGAVACWQTLGKHARAKRLSQLGPIVALAGVAMDEPVSTWSNDQLNLIWSGSATPAVIGLNGILQRDFDETELEDYRFELEQLRGSITCPDCNGTRISAAARAVLLKEQSIAQLTAKPVGELMSFFELSQGGQTAEEMATAKLITEIRHRLDFLQRVGLDYLSLDRSTETLSGGELQRVRLASSIGSGLTNVCFVLDEPSKGLHSRDSQRLIDVLKELKNAGNTLLVVEHDEAIMSAADHLIDMGPGAGTTGGDVVDQGPPRDIATRSLGKTGRFLARKTQQTMPFCRRTPDWTKAIRIVGARANNLCDIDVALPTGVLVCITGVSGSGKSSLVHETVVPAVRRFLGLSAPKETNVAAVRNMDAVSRIVVVDQRAIGRTPRGCPATYTGVFDEIRKVFAATKAAKQLGFTSRRFSFNSAEGWCPDCRGQGQKRIEMKFLPDLFVTCATCDGNRFNRQTLAVRFRDLSIAGVLKLGVEQAYDVFENIESIRSRLQSLLDVGLGYVQLGQPSTTLSGGEAQRVRLAAELANGSSQGGLFVVLDEPTTGLHFDDVRQLVKVLQKFVEGRNSVLVIEHHLDVIAAADWVIDLGPEGGNSGGKVVAVGTPEQIAASPISQTGRFLVKALGA